MTAHESSRSSNCSAAVGSWLRTGTTVSTDQDPMSSVTGNGPSSCAADMDGGRILFDVAARISDTARKRITKGAGTGGDVLLSHKGTVGKLALAPLNAPPFVCSPQTTFWRTLNEEEIDRRYLYYYMCSADFRATRRPKRRNRYGRLRESDGPTRAANHGSSLRTMALPDRLPRVRVRPV